MACRVGITTDPQRRKREWKAEHPRLWNWRILSRYYSKTAAQRRETAEANRRSCVSRPGGAGPEDATWFVYYFEY